MSTATAEWWRGWIITREGSRVALGARYTNSGIVICPNPRWQWLRPVVELVVLVAVLSLAALFVRLPRPLTLTALAVWIPIRNLFAHALPQITRRIVLDDEHLRVEAPGAPVIPRFALIRREEISEVSADAVSVRVRRRHSQYERMPLGPVSAATARTIAQLLNESLGSTRS